MLRRSPRTGMSLASLWLALKADLACNQAPLDRLTVAVFRLGQYAITKPAPVRVGWSILGLVYTRLLIGAELPPQVRCGPRLTLLHAGRGVIVHPDVRLGADARISHRVTIGIRRERRRGVCLHYRRQPALAARRRVTGPAVGPATARRRHSAARPASRPVK